MAARSLGSLLDGGDEAEKVIDALSAQQQILQEEQGAFFMTIEQCAHQN